MADKWYIGEDLKFLVEMTATGFSMDDDDWSVTVMISNKPVAEFKKEDCVRGDDQNWYVCVPAEVLKKGPLTLVGHARIPDVDFEDDIRDEIEVKSMGKIEKV